MKKILLKTFLGFSILTSTGLFQPISVLANTDSPTHKSSYAKLKDLNSTINQRLFDLREYPHKHDKTAPKCNYHWFKYVTNINYLKNDQLEVYVTPKFQTLSEELRQEIIYHAQIFSLQLAEKNQKISATQYHEGLATIVFCDGNYLGRSHYLYNHELSWKK